MSSTSASPSPSPLAEPDAPSLSQNPYIHQGQDDTDWSFIRGDLKKRVFIDFEDFIKTVLLIPGDWKYAWGLTIEAVKADSDFQKHYGEYHKLCEDFGTHEELPHKSLMNTAKAAFDVATRCIFGDIPPQTADRAARHRAPQSSNEGYRETTIHILEVDPHYGALCDGRSMPRLLSSGGGCTTVLSALGRS